MSANELVNPYLSALRTRSTAVATAAADLRDAMSEAQLTWRPSRGTWSIADCFEHLRKVDKSYCRILGDVVQRAITAQSAPFRPSLPARLYLWFISPGTRIPIPAPRGIRPEPIPAGEGGATIGRFIEQQRELQDVLVLSDGRDINSARFGSPVLPAFKLSLGEGLTGLVLHEERHLAQALRLTRHPGFPAV
jgi:hypothetical protein